MRVPSAGDTFAAPGTQGCHGEPARRQRAAPAAAERGPTRGQKWPFSSRACKSTRTHAAEPWLSPHESFHAQSRDHFAAPSVRLGGRPPSPTHALRASRPGRGASRCQAPSGSGPHASRTAGLGRRAGPRRRTLVACSRDERAGPRAAKHRDAPGARVSAVSGQRGGPQGKDNAPGPRPGSGAGRGQARGPCSQLRRAQPGAPSEQPTREEPGRSFSRGPSSETGPAGVDIWMRRVPRVTHMNGDAGRHTVQQ